MEKHEVVVFNDDDFSLEVNIDKDKETVWLTQDQIALLFNVDRTRIVRHINNIYNDDELDKYSTCAENAQVQIEGAKKVNRNIKYYNLDMIISVGYRVKSKRGIVFRRWANKILKSYLLEGYVVNKKRLDYLQKQIKLIDIASRIDEKVTSVEGSKILDVILEYKKALDLLDDYDYRTLTKPQGTLNAVLITYEECKKIIDSMKFNSSIFGVERDDSFHPVSMQYIKVHLVKMYMKLLKRKPQIFCIL